MKDFDKLPTDWMYARETRLQLSGVVGPLEVLVNGLEKPRALALICHPHPLHGGSLENKVVFTLARACRDSGVIAVRFNFRGVGGSAGIYDKGLGEALDAECLFKSFQSALPGMPVLLAGFSFGAAVALKVAQNTYCDGVIVVAPPVPDYCLRSICSVNTSVALFQCEDDEIVNSQVVFDWLEKIDAPVKSINRWRTGGHFFHGMLPELKSAVTAELTGLLR